MKIDIFKKLFYSLSALAIFCLITPSAGAIGIYPLRNELNVEPGQSVQGEVVVVNETDQDFSAEPVVKAFYKNDSEGFPVYPSSEESSENPEDFVSWIHIPNEPVFVPSKSEVKVPFTVTVPASAKGGGRYATIAYQPVITDYSGIVVNVRAASLLYVNVQGQLKHAGKLTYFGLSEAPSASGLLSFSVVFSNTGNTHLKPQGTIELTDLDTGEKLKGIGEVPDPETRMPVLSDSIPVNFYKSCVLPGSSRTYSGEWKQGLRPGRFRADLSLTYEGLGDPITQSAEFQIEKGALEVLAFTADPLDQPSAFHLTLRNQGSFAQKFEGSVKITDIFGSKISEVDFPPNLAPIAPGQTQLLTLEWKDNKVPKDRYKAKLVAHYGFMSEPLIAKTSFGRLNPVKLYFGFGFVVFFGAFLITAFLILHRRRKRRVHAHKPAHSHKASRSKITRTKRRK